MVAVAVVFAIHSCVTVRAAPAATSVNVPDDDPIPKRSTTASARSAYVGVHTTDPAVTDAVSVSPAEIGRQSARKSTPADP
mgnify:CR=1 FL=1